MTIPKHQEAEILRLAHAEKWPVGTIATQLGVHYSVVRRVLDGQAACKSSVVRPSKADPFVPFIIQTLEEHHRLRASRLYDMVVDRGYVGSQGHFRRIVRRYRPRKAAEAFLRLRTLPGEQAQVDWANFGRIQVGKAVRPLVAFVMVLSYSRRIFLRFFLGQAMSQFLQGHVEAFAFFGGVPRELLYDNLKSAVLERAGDTIRFHPTLLELASHYRYAPKPVAVARGNEKGRVERAIQYARHAFFEARKYSDLADLNAQTRAWCLGPANQRPCPEDRDRTVAEVFNDEAALLLPLPAVPFPDHDVVGVRAGKTPYVRFDLNDYSVPHTHVRRPLQLIASESTVRVIDGAEVVAEHRRSYDRGAQIEDPRHIQDLVDEKRAASKEHAVDRLHHLVPSTRAFLAQMAQKQGSISSTVRQLLNLLELHGAAELEAAVAKAAAGGAYHLTGVRHVLDQRRQAKGLKPPLNVPLRPELRNMTIDTHDLAGYDKIYGDAEENDRG